MTVEISGYEYDGLDVSDDRHKRESMKFLTATRDALRGGVFVEPVLCSCTEGHITAL